jgi:hypothetical protein
MAENRSNPMSPAVVSMIESTESIKSYNCSGMELSNGTIILPQEILVKMSLFCRHNPPQLPN